MTGWKVAAVASSAAALAVAVMLAARGDFERGGIAGEAAVRSAASPQAQSPSRSRPHGVVEDCSSRSLARFPGALSDPHNVIVGPLILVGAADTPASTVRRFGGNKFPALVRVGHRVTVALSPRTRLVAGLGYGPLPQAVELTPRDGHRVVTFIACQTAEKSGSTADGRPVTFWSGFVLTSSPRCVPLDVWVDDEPSPRPIVLRMGVPRCLGAPAG